MKNNLTTLSRTTMHNDLEAYWMPFTANASFKQSPRLLVKADGMFYTSHDGRDILDGCAGLWCVNAGHRRKHIADAITAQLEEMDFAPSFQVSHPKAFSLASRLTSLTPDGLDSVFFTNSGSESVDTALKAALGYHRLCGQGQRRKLIGREKGYHGANFGGTAVGGMVQNRKIFGNLVSDVDHLPHTLLLPENAFSQGQPTHGVERADALEDLCQLHDPSTIAAVIIEPVACSGGVILPPVDYLKRIRKICDQHGILLIFDEVITGFGRLGTPFASQYFDVIPDIMTCAKGLTNGTIPMGAVFFQKHIYDTFMEQNVTPIEFAHGYTYSAHPIAVAAANATLDVYEQDNLLTRASSVAPYWEQALHSLKSASGVVDIRNLGLLGAVQLDPQANKNSVGPTRAHDVFVNAFEAGCLIRYTGDILAFSPPLVAENHHIDRLVETLATVLKTT